MKVQSNNFLYGLPGEPSIEGLPVTLLIIILFINPMVSWIKILKTKNTRAVIKEKDTNRLSLLL